MTIMLAITAFSILAGVLALVSFSASIRKRKADQERLENDEAHRIIEQASLVEAARRRRIEERLRALNESSNAIAAPSVIAEPAIDQADDQQHAETAKAAPNVEP